MNIFETGKFFIGCNYWASHAGTAMWNDWCSDAIEEDFLLLSKHGVNVLRVFPLWSVFQPINLLRKHEGIPREYRFGEDPLPDTDTGKMGMSEKALSLFNEFCVLAEKYGLKLVVGLITGWMSGRLFVPPALEGRNIITDPTAIMWQTRFIRCFVDRFKDSPAIIAWDLGNECNCMGSVSISDESYIWTSNMVGTIKSSDDKRPIVSGMHSLSPDGLWQIQHQAELTDILTTHPYPIFTPHCDMEPLNTIRTELHAVAETLYYRGIGGKPCFPEECGTIGPFIGDDDTDAEFIRTNLFTLWAHDCMGFMWWCANEQTHLKTAPYDWNSCERELGLFTKEKTPKPVLHVIEDFNNFINTIGIDKLPQRLTDGICILTREQDTWGVAYMSFILAKQAGLDIEFIYADQPLPESSFYMMPSLSGVSSMTQNRFDNLLDKVKEGAVLYISINDALLSPFREYSGLNVITREKSESTENVKITNGNKKFNIQLNINYKLKLEACSAEVLATNKDGSPIFAVNNYGKGKIFFLAAPLEISLTKVKGAFDEKQSKAISKNDDDSAQYTIFYEIIKQSLLTEKVAYVENQNIGITEHVLDGSKRLLILINYGPKLSEVKLSLEKGWKINKILRGNLQMTGNDASVFEITSI